MSFPQKARPGVAGKVLTARLEDCGNPRCGNPHFNVFWPGEDGCEPISSDLSFSIEDGLIHVDKDGGQDCGPGGEKIDLPDRALDNLKDEEVLQLRNWLNSRKCELAHSTPPDQIVIDDLPFFEPGVKVGFLEIFPLAMLFKFSALGGEWSAADKFYANPKCSCSTCVFTFLKATPPAEPGAMPRRLRAPAVGYDYVARKVGIVERGGGFSESRRNILGDGPNLSRPECLAENAA